MWSCKLCGTKNEDEQNYCKFCNTHISGPKFDEAKPPSPPKPLQPQQRTTYLSLPEIDLKKCNILMQSNILPNLVRDLDIDTYLIGKGRTKGNLRHLVVKALIKNWTPDKLDKKLKRFKATEDLKYEVQLEFLNFTSWIYNQVRLELFCAAKQIVGILYTVPIDSKTSSICRNLDGMMWRKNDLRWDKFVPPNHDGCRAVICPLLEGDEPEKWDDPPAYLEPAEGFGGTVGSVVTPAGSLQHPGYKKVSVPDYR